MAQNKQALRARIRSIDTTRKITKAMEMIANAKLVKQRNLMEKNREYAQILQDTVNEIVTENPDVDVDFLKARKNEAKITLVICSDLGLCGAYNQNIVKMMRSELRKEDPVILIGTSLYRTLKEEGWNMINEYPLSSDRQTHLSLKEEVQRGTELYLNGEVGTVQLLYTKFVNTMSFQPTFDQLLPCEKIKKNQKKDVLHAETLFEPNAESILSKLIPMMIENVTYSDWLETKTAEQGSRRLAMKAATDNADELSESLLLEYNKARQAGITQEITEIVGGSAAV